MENKLYFKGMTYGWCDGRGDYRKPEAFESMKKLKELGCEWIALTFYTYQDHFYSTNIYFDYGYTVTDRDITHAVENAHKLGLKVCLKPVVNCRDKAWRAKIDFPDFSEGGYGDLYWDPWFASYTGFILHYAELAQDTGCEMYCLGCEMMGTERKINHWRKLIEEVRLVYSGLLTYNAQHGNEEKVQWFDMVDIIGTSAYYRVADTPEETEENMANNWKKSLVKLDAIYERFKKPIVFMEIGCRSAHGCSTMPWNSYKELPADEEEQARFYSSAYKATENIPWFGGFFWWDWKSRLYDLKDAKNDVSFGIYGKRAADVVKEWYNKI